MPGKLLLLAALLVLPTHMDALPESDAAGRGLCCFVPPLPPLPDAALHCRYHQSVLFHHRGRNSTYKIMGDAILGPTRLGPWGGWLIAGLQYFINVGTTITNMILAGQLLQSVYTNLCTGERAWWDRAWTSCAASKQARLPDRQPASQPAGAVPLSPRRAQPKCLVG